MRSCYVCLRHRTRSRKYRYYTCGTGKRLGADACNNSPISCSTLERKVFDVLLHILGSPTDRSALIDLLRSESERIIQASSDSFASLSKRYKDNLRKIENCKNVILDGLISKTITEELSRLEAENKDIEEQQKSLYNAAHGASLPTALMEQSLDILLSDVTEYRQPYSAAMLSLFSLVARVEVFKDHIRVWTIVDIDSSGNLRPASPKNVIKTDGDTSPAPSILITGTSIQIASVIIR